MGVIWQNRYNKGENTEGGTGTITPAMPVPVQNNETMKRTYQKKKVIMTAAEKQQMKQYTNTIRVCRNIDPTQETKIALVWVLPFDMKRFTLYPFVIHIDEQNFGEDTTVLSAEGKVPMAYGAAQGHLSKDTSVPTLSCLSRRRWTCS
jgi:hypothetical protein